MNPYNPDNNNQNNNPYDGPLVDQNTSPYGSQFVGQNTSPYGPQFVGQNTSPYGPQFADQNTSPYEPRFVDQNTSPYGPRFVDQSTSPYGPRFVDQNTSPYGPRFVDQNTSPYGSGSVNRNNPPYGGQTVNRNNRPDPNESGRPNVKQYNLKSNNRQSSYDEAAYKRRLARKEAARKKRKRQWYLRLFLRLGLPVLAILIMLIASIRLLVKSSKGNEEQTVEEPSVSIAKEEEEIIEEEEVISTPEVSDAVYSAVENASTTGLPSDVVSSYGILIDLNNNSILAQQNARTRISPASMTKILTVLVAAEHITPDQLNDTVTITLEYTDYSYGNDLSAAGFAEGEVVTVRDLFYGTILPSGGDAAIALATYVAGSEEAFVNLMNEKLQMLSLSDSTHFTNVAGMFNEEHYSTVYDMAMIMHAAIDNDICREVLNAHTYTTSQTEQHPEGITISNWFLRRIEDKDCGLTVECAKTGFVVQSRNCAASFADSPDGRRFICVTADSSSAWRCIYDHVSIYSSFSGITQRPDIPSDEVLPDDDSTNPDKPDQSTMTSSSSSSTARSTSTAATTNSATGSSSSSSTSRSTANTQTIQDNNPTNTGTTIIPQASNPQNPQDNTQTNNNELLVIEDVPKNETQQDNGNQSGDNNNTDDDKPESSYDEIIL